MANDTIRLDWWNKARPHELIWQAVERLERRYQPTHERWLNQLKIFSDRAVRALGPDGYDQCDASEPTRRNVTRNAVQTMAVKTTRNRPRTVFLPRGAKPSVKRQCELLEKFIAGLTDHNEVREKSELVVYDAEIYGVGGFRTSWEVPPGSDRADIVTERVLPWQILYDPAECQGGRPPRTLYQCNLIDRETLAMLYPEAKREISELPRAQSPIQNSACVSGGSQETLMDGVRVVEAWHLPSYKGAEDGKYTVVARGITLEPPRPYKHDDFPLSFLTWSPAPLGWHIQASSLVEEGRGPQKALENIVERVDASFDIAPSFINNPPGSGLENGEITDRIDLPILNGNPEAMPTVEHAPPMHPAYLEREQTLTQTYYDLVGVSQASATARKPAGVEAAVAMQTLADQESERYLAWHYRYGSLFSHVAKCQIRAAADAAAAGYDVESFHDEVDEAIKWNDVGLEEHQFSVKVQSVSNLPKDLAGQVELANQFVAGQLLPKEDALDLIVGLPDLDAKRELYMADRIAVERDVEDILNGAQRLPDKHDALPYAKDYARRMYLRHRRKSTPDAMKRLARYIDAAEALIAGQAAAMAPPPMMAPPGAAPAMDPTMAAGMPPVPPPGV